MEKGHTFGWKLTSTMGMHKDTAEKINNILNDVKNLNNDKNDSNAFDTAMANLDNLNEDQVDILVSMLKEVKSKIEERIGELLIRKIDEMTQAAFIPLVIRLSKMEEAEDKPEYITSSFSITVHISDPDDDFVKENKDVKFIPEPSNS